MNREQIGDFGVGYGDDDIVRLKGSDTGGGGGGDNGGTENHPPVCSDDAVTTNMGQPVTVGISGGDADLDKLTFSITSGPSSGSVDGTTYTPDGNFYGEDSFTYVANDGHTNSQTCTVTITVKEVRKYYVVEVSGVGYQKTFSTSAYKVTGYEYDLYYRYQSEMDGVISNDFDNTAACAAGAYPFPVLQPMIWESKQVRLIAGPLDTSPYDDYKCPVPNYVTSANPICNHWVKDSSPSYYNNINSICGN